MSINLYNMDCMEALKDMAIDLAMVEQSTVVVALEGAHRSNGSRREINKAINSGITLIHESYLFKGVV